MAVFYRFFYMAAPEIGIRMRSRDSQMYISITFDNQLILIFQ